MPAPPEHENPLPDVFATDAIDAEPLEAPEPAFDVEPESGELAADALPPGAAWDRKIERLVAGGFEPERAAAIVEQEAALRLAAVYEEFEATGTIRAFNAGGGAMQAARLREALGDAEYERYLQANGSPTRVRIDGFDASSPAAYAGFEPGDEIVSYAGERVFNLRDLHALMLTGTPGETVPATVLRGGQPLELYVTRGPVGLVEGGLDEPAALP
jgi:predicted metalloprotease with PDZ domain